MLDDFKGLNQRSPWFAAMMLLIMVSMIGVPPLAGFYAKWWVLASVLDAGHLWLAIIGVLTSVNCSATVARYIAEQFRGPGALADHAARRDRPAADRRGSHRSPGIGKRGRVTI